jgi:hypothetical protein
MHLSQTSQTWAADDQTWLRSRHGLESAVPCTLDTSTFTANLHYPDGFLKSGLALTLNGTSQKYEPWATTKVLAGFLAFSVPVVSVNGVVDTTADPVGAMVDHVSVVKARLPIAVDATGFSTCPTVRAY